MFHPKQKAFRFLLAYCSSRGQSYFDKKTSMPTHAKYFMFEFQIPGEGSTSTEYWWGDYLRRQYLNGRNGKNLLKTNGEAAALPVLVELVRNALVKH